MEMNNQDYWQYKDFDPNSEFHQSEPQSYSSPIYFPVSKKNLYQSPVIFLPPLIAPDEEWRFITDVVIANIVPFRYIVSNYGRIFDLSLNKFIKNILGDSYYLVNLSYYDIASGKLKRTLKQIHRIVLLIFNYIYNCEYLQVNHINGNRFDNRLCNLEWCTNKENIIHAYNTGLIGKNENHANAKLSNDQVEQICQCLVDNEYSTKELMEKFNVSFSTISAIRNKKSYVDISSKYDLKNIYDYSDELIEFVESVCILMENGYSNIEIAKIKNTNVDKIRSIRRGRSYKSISKNFNIQPQNIHLTEDQVHNICNLLENNFSVNEISKKIQIDASKIYGIAEHKSFINISKNYNF